MRFEKGRTYTAGIDLPFFVSQSMAKEGAEKKGFRVLELRDRRGTDGDISGLPWDTFGRGVFQGETADIALPSQVRWVRDETTPSAPPILVEKKRDIDDSGALVFFLVVIGIGAYLGRRK